MSLDGDTQSADGWIMSDERSAPWAFWGVLSLLVVVAVGLLVVPGLLAPQPTPAPPRPTATPTIDRHVITTAQGTFRFGIDGSDIVINEVTPTARELGRIPVLAGFDPSASVQTISGGGSWILACPDAAPGDALRIWFGLETDLTDARYSGPAAVSSFAEDGTWMVILDPGELDPGALLDMTTKNGESRNPATLFASVLADPTTAQPSGCHLG